MGKSTRPMSKRQFRIGELAQALNVEKYVVRFWEKEFCLHTDRSQGGQRFYTDDDLDIFQSIKRLLYEQGFTIAGAKKQLLSKHRSIAPAKKSHSEHESDNSTSLSDELDIMKSKLLEIKNLL